jgi:hypothetical protein
MYNLGYLNLLFLFLHIFILLLIIFYTHFGPYSQLYLVDFNRAELDTCLVAKTNMSWLWHRRLAHVGLKNLHKLLKGEHILGLTNVYF